MQVSFGHAIKVNSNLKLNENRFNRVNPVLQDIFEVFNGKPSEYLNEEDSNRVKNFLRTEIDDFSEKTGAIYRELDGDIFLFTGKDVENLRKVDTQTQKLIHQKRKPEDSKCFCQEALKTRANVIRGMIEDGMNYRKNYIELFVGAKQDKVTKLVMYKWPYENALGMSILDLEA